MARYNDKLRCGCQDGMDCTKVTACHVQLIVDEYNDLMENIDEWLAMSKAKIPGDAIEELQNILKARP